MTEDILDYIRKNARIGTVVMVLTALCFVFFVVVTLCSNAIQSYGNEIYFGFLAMMIGLVGLVLYFRKYSGARLSLKLLENYNLTDLVRDFNTNVTPHLQRTGIYFAGDFLYIKKMNAFLPYSAMAWVYKEVQKVNGIPVAKGLIIRFKKGEKFSLKMKQDEMEKLAQVLVEKNPEIHLGFAASYQKDYKEKMKNDNWD